MLRILVFLGPSAWLCGASRKGAFGSDRVIAWEGTRISKKVSLAVRLPLGLLFSAFGCQRGAGTVLWGKVTTHQDMADGGSGLLH